MEWVATGREVSESKTVMENKVSEAKEIMREMEDHMIQLGGASYVAQLNVHTRYQEWKNGAN